MKRSSFRRIRRSEQGSLHELNITPLLDLVFVLLVIFIITTPQLSNSLEINLPSGKPTPPPANTRPPEINRIAVNEKGEIRFNQKSLALPALRTTLAERKAVDPEFAVVVEGSDDVEYQNMINVLDILQQLDITKVGLATQAAPP